MRKMALVFAMWGVAFAATAGQGEVCASAPKPATSNPLANETVFRCKAAGNGTVSQLYAKGWRVVAVFPQMTAVEPTGLPMSEWAVVIEKV